MKLVDTWDEWGAVYARLDFWRDEIRTICESNRVEPQRLDCTFPGTHAVFFVNEDTVLKIFCPVRYNTYRKELRLHNGPLAQNPVFPQVRFHGKSPSGYDYIAFSMLRGRPVRLIGRDAIPEVAIRDLAHAIIALQSKTLERTDGGLRCLVHYDLTEDHVYLDSEGRLEGIIDFGDAKMGHPSEEFPVLFVACLGCDDSLIAVFREACDDKAEHYRIDDGDVAEALKRHPFRRDIIAHLHRLDTRFARDLLHGVE